MNYYAKFKDGVFNCHITTETSAEDINNYSSKYSYVPITEEQYIERFIPEYIDRNIELVNSIKLVEAESKKKKDIEVIKQKLIKARIEVMALSDMNMDYTKEQDLVDSLVSQHNQLTSIKDG